MLFDTHAHYNDEKFDKDRYELLDAMPGHNVGFIVNAADSMESVGKVMSLCRKYPFMYAAIGVHPEECAHLTEQDMDILKQQAQDKKVAAIGEIGLDYHWESVPKEVQKKWFVRQLELAEQIDLPVVIHDREAHGDCMDILRNFAKGGIRGVMHCFSGSVEMAKEIISMGMYIGIGGTVTFKNAKKVQEVVKEIPLSNIVLETDCPYLAPEPHRGERNNSAYMSFVADKIAEIKGIGAGEVENITWDNARKLYGI